MQFLSDDRLLERRIFASQSILLDDTAKAAFPPLDDMESEILEMESAAVDYEFTFFCTPYVRICDKGWFLDVYFRYESASIYGSHFPNHEGKFEKEILSKRIIIAPGYLMTEEDEWFLDKVSHTVYFIQENDRVSSTENIIAELKEVAPDLHICDYKDTKDVLLHAYYASHRSGVREFLYKAGLHEIANHLTRVCGYNMIASNLQEAFGLQLGLLKKVNHLQCLDVLKDEQSRLLAQRVYREHHNTLRKYDSVNVYMLLYLDSLKNSKADQTVLESLSTLESGFNETGKYIRDKDVYKRYMEYLRFREGFGKKHKYFPKFVNLNIQSSVSYQMLFDLSEKYGKTDFNETFKNRYNEWSRFAYENDEYKVVVPETIQQFLDESQQQHNCLFTMMDEILRGKSIVLFMRSRKAPDESLVTFEIYKGRIIQAKRRFNESITSKDRVFLSEFAKKKGLKMI